MWISFQKRYVSYLSHKNTKVNQRITKHIDHYLIYLLNHKNEQNERSSHANKRIPLNIREYLDSRFPRTDFKII